MPCASTLQTLPHTRVSSDESSAAPGAGPGLGRAVRTPSARGGARVTRLARLAPAMLASASADASGRLDAGDAPFARATAAPPDADATANNASGGRPRGASATPAAAT